MCVIDTGARQTHEDLHDNIVGGWNRCGMLGSPLLLDGLRVLGTIFRRELLCAAAAAPEPQLAAPAHRLPAGGSHFSAPPPRLAKPFPPARAPCAHPCRAELDDGQPQPGSAAYSDLSDAVGHGTHTAGIIGAQGNNGLGVAGMSWQVSLHICKASTDE